MCCSPPPAPVIQIPDNTPAPLPAPTFTAADGTVFNDMAAFNTYNNNLNQQTFNNSISDASTKAKASATSKLSAVGMGNSPYADYFNKYYDAAGAMVPKGDADPSAYFSTDPVDQFITDAGKNARKSTLDTLNTGLPVNYATMAMPTSYGDNSVSAYLNNLQSSVDGALSNAQKRGQLDPTGLAAAQTEEARQRSVGQGHLSQIASDIGTTERSNLGSQRDAAFTAANNWQLGQAPVDVNAYLDNINGQAKTDQSGFTDKFNSQADGYNPFDINAILLKAGIGSGPNDTAGAVNTGTLGTASDIVKRMGPRGLGTTGPF